MSTKISTWNLWKFRQSRHNIANLRHAVDHNERTWTFHPFQAPTKREGALRHLNLSITRHGIRDHHEWRVGRAETLQTSRFWGRYNQHWAMGMIKVRTPLTVSVTHFGIQKLTWCTLVPFLPFLKSRLCSVRRVRVVNTALKNWWQGPNHLPGHP